MLKINASYGLKEGRPNFGSESALCSVEMEVSDSVSADELKGKIHGAFCIVREQCRQELSANGNGGQTAPNADHVALPPARTGTKASNRQIKFLTDLCQQRGISLADLNADIRQRFDVDGLYDLDRKQASTLLDEMNGKRKAA